MDIYLIRHGQSTGNGVGRLLGWSDLPLSDAGRVQAGALARRFASLGPLPVFCSDLQRARETAETIAAGWQGSIEADPRWREINCGRYECCTWDEFNSDAELARQLACDPLGAVIPDGESVQLMAARAVEVFTELVAREHERIIVVAHDGPIRAVLAHCLQLPPERFWTLTMEHGSISRLIVKEDWISVHSVNDTGHLAGVAG